MKYKIKTWVPIEESVTHNNVTYGNVPLQFRKSLPELGLAGATEVELVDVVSKARVLVKGEARFSQPSFAGGTAVTGITVYAIVWRDNLIPA